jgi:hypothetical protein
VCTDAAQRGFQHAAQLTADHLGIHIGYDEGRRSKTVPWSEALAEDCRHCRGLMKDAVTLYLQARLDGEKHAAKTVDSAWPRPRIVTFDAIFSRLTDVALASINIANTLALFGAVLCVITPLMRTIVPLRIFRIFGDMFFIGYAVLANSVTTLFLYILLLPINSVRLYQMVKLVKKARVSAQGDLSMSWLEPYMSRRKYRKGNVLFLKGEAANEMFIAVTGNFRVPELGKELPPGTVFGELGFLSKNNLRTQSVECTGDGEVLTITYDKLLDLYSKTRSSVAIFPPHQRSSTAEHSAARGDHRGEPGRHRAEQGQAARQFGERGDSRSVIGSD